MERNQSKGRQQMGWSYGLLGPTFFGPNLCQKGVFGYLSGASKVESYHISKSEFDLVFHEVT